MMKKCILIIMPLVLALVLSACSPAEPPVESPADSSTPIGTPADTPLDTPAETPEPYDFSKIRFRTDEIMVIGEIKDIEEYNAKTAELTEACRNFEPVPIENGVKHPDYIMFDVMFNSGCDMSDEEIAEIGLEFHRRQNEELTDIVRLLVCILNENNENVKSWPDKILELSQSDKVEYVEILPGFVWTVYA